MKLLILLAMVIMGTGLYFVSAEPQEYLIYDNSTLVYDDKGHGELRQTFCEYMLYFAITDINSQAETAKQKFIQYCQ